MRKVLLLSIMLTLVLLGVNGVGAEEILVDEVLEPTAWDNWLASIGDWASFKNALLSTFSVSGVIITWKLLGLLKFLRSKDGVIALENFGVRILGKISKSPELVISIMKLVVEFPVIKQILDKAKLKADMYETELLGKILDIEAKLSAGVFETDKLPEAIAYLTKLRDEYENLNTVE
jgi:hypothetical protein